MDELFAELDQRVPPASVLGYLNFSDGRPDPRWQKHTHDAAAFLAQRGQPQPWNDLQRWLAGRLDSLRASGGSAFRDVTQARDVLRAFAELLPAYREHHADLLAHQSDAELFGPFFLVRVFETILASRSGGEMPAIADVLTRLNDFVGYRPIAVLETRPRGEPYPHERHRPLPIYLRGVGVAHGRYHDILERALDILRGSDPDLLNASHLDLELLDEFAVDLRAYDHGHPVNRRPNYVFGEWDPHHIDNQGRYRRYVARQITLDGLLARVEQPGERGKDELLFEAAAVLAGTILMATGISGWGPGAHDSSANLTSLMPGIVRCRDQFYQQLLHRIAGPHAERLRHDLETTRQPFGGARQHLNAYLARHRAAQMQQRYLALVFAEMGYADASRDEARRIPTASVRFLSEMLTRISTGHYEAEHGRLEEASAVLPEVQELLRRGIDCGALADPWNVLGFHAMFPLSPAQEDALRDQRLDELVQVVEQVHHLYARLSSEAASTGKSELASRLVDGLRRHAAWWDRYATFEVSEIRRVHGEEAASSAAHVVDALGRWHERGEASADLGFWKQHLDTFRTPKAFALVVDALLRKQDYRAGMALLINWVSQYAEVDLEDGPYSFHHLTLRWLLGAAGGEGGRPDPALVQKFFDYLEANAEDLWHVPALEPPEANGGQGERELYSAAWEDVTYKDSTAGEESSVAGSEGEREKLELEQEGPRLASCLHFQSTLARLWAVAARAVVGESWSNGGAAPGGMTGLTTAAWCAVAREHLGQLLALLDAVHDYPIPAPEGNYESLVEFDRRRVFKEQMLYSAVGTCLDMSLAVGALTAASDGEDASHLPSWGPWAIRLERAMFRGEVEAAREALAGFLEPFRQEPLLFTPLADGGHPRQILRVRVAQAMLRVLLLNLPRLGLIRETLELLRTARQMEQAPAPQTRRVTEFNQYFPAGFAEAVEAVVESSAGWGPEFDDAKLVALLERLTAPCHALWVEHSRTVQISSLETVGDEAEWERLRSFVRRYGSEVFHARFMTLANLRGVLHRGADSFIDYLRQESDPLRPSRLAAEVGRVIPRADAVRRLELVLRAVTENYEEYKDYNATTNQSDYGENLHILLDFLRLKVAYERRAWELQPLVLVHEVLARRGRRQAALLWERMLTRMTGELARQFLNQLGELERTRGARLNTVGDRLRERFVKPLALDRLRALVEPAILERQQGGPTPSFARLQEELRAYTATPTGVGLDVPAWLQLLKAEVNRVLATRSTLATLAEGFARATRRPMSLDEVKRQLEDWERGAPS